MIEQTLLATNPAFGLPATSDQPEPRDGRHPRVLIADHDGFARQLMRAALHDADRTVTVLSAANGSEALELARYHHPTVALLDITLPPDGAIAVLRKLLAITPQTKILTISADEQQPILDALRAGAVGHIAKDTKPDEFARLVSKALDGEAIVPQPLLMPLLQLVRELPDRGWRPVRSRLTAREWEIIELIEQGNSTHQIADQLVLSPTTIYSHIKNIHRKLDVHNRDQAIHAAKQLRTQETSQNQPTPPN